MLGWAPAVTLPLRWSVEGKQDWDWVNSLPEGQQKGFKGRGSNPDGMSIRKGCQSSVTEHSTQQHNRGWYPAASCSTWNESGPVIKIWKYILQVTENFLWRASAPDWEDGSAGEMPGMDGHLSVNAQHPHKMSAILVLGSRDIRVTGHAWCQSRWIRELEFR